MNFIVSGNTDIGTTKSTNQDSLSVKVIKTPQGNMVFAILCDGMGGLKKGEVASATVVRAFDIWARTELPKLCNKQIADYTIHSQWEELVMQQNKKIKEYGKKHNIHLGTTVVAMLLTQNRYYIMNVGDCRVYEISNTIQQITKDQTFVAREVSLGNMTEEEARTDIRRNVLLQCIGDSDTIYPDMFFGDVKEDAVYMLCSDGFRHEISTQEIQQAFLPQCLLSEQNMNEKSIELIELNKSRKEKDNISVVLVRTY